MPEMRAHLKELKLSHGTDNKSNKQKRVGFLGGNEKKWPDPIALYTLANL